MTTYIIRAGLTGPVKIGKADDVERRRAELQTAHHEELYVIRVIDTAFDAEPLFHQRFADRRIRGEWFEFDLEMLTFIPEPTPTSSARTLGGLVSRFGVKKLAERLLCSRRTVENWAKGNVSGPQARHAVAMLRDPELAPIVLLAAGREDLANPVRTMRELRAEVATKYGADHPLVKEADDWLAEHAHKLVDADQMGWT